jgi:hypothetical protein
MVMGRLIIGESEEFIITEARCHEPLGLCRWSVSDQTEAGKSLMDAVLHALNKEKVGQALGV